MGNCLIGFDVSVDGGCIDRRRRRRRRLLREKEFVTSERRQTVTAALAKFTMGQVKRVFYDSDDGKPPILRARSKVSLDLVIFASANKILRSRE